MTWSLRINNGDFVVTSAHLGTVTAQQKLLQDFRCAILEQMGTDNLHPDYGSLIDGGINSSGEVVSGVIGNINIDEVTMIVESEISRIARYIQRAQLARAKSDKLTYGRATLVPQEVLLSLNGITFEQREDLLNVTIFLTAANDESFEVQLAINESPSEGTS
jgi:hypothetical protein